MFIIKATCLLNIAVIIAIVLDTILGVRGADPIFGIAIALWLLWGAYKAAQMALDHLLDREWPAEKRERFLAVAKRHPEMNAIHDVRTRSSGMHDFVQFHVWFDPNKTLGEAHAIMDEVEADLEREFPGVEVLIHPEPRRSHPRPSITSMRSHDRTALLSCRCLCGPSI